MRRRISFWHKHGDIFKLFGLIFAILGIVWIYAGFIADGTLEGCDAHMTPSGVVYERCVNGHKFYMNKRVMTPVLDNDGRPVICN